MHIHSFVYPPCANTLAHIWEPVQANWHQKLLLNYKLPHIVSVESKISFEFLTHFPLAVDKKEINQLHANFIRECRAGVLSRADLLHIYRLFFPFGDPEPFVLRLMEMFRGRGTGVGIGFEDYVQGMSVISRGRVDEKLKWAFRFCDLNADGAVHLEDLMEVAHCVNCLIGGMFDFPLSSAHDRIQSIFALMDADGDGQADEEDFRRVALEDPEIVQGLLLYDGVI